MSTFKDIEHAKMLLAKEREEIIAILSKIGTRVGASDSFIPSVQNFGDDITEPEDEEADEAEEFGNRLGVHHVLQERLNAIDRDLDHIAKGTYVPKPRHPHPEGS